jgi:hypothetical protein
LREEGQKRQTFDELVSANKELSGRLEYRWRPVITYILNSVDERYVSLQNKKGGFSRDVREDNYKMVIDVDSEKSRGIELRRVTFPNGNEVSLVFYPLQIQRGKFIKNGQLEFIEVSKGKNGDVMIKLLLQKDGCSTHVWNNRYSEFRLSTTEDPLMDNSIIQKFNGIVNMLFTNMYFVH